MLTELYGEKVSKIALFPDEYLPSSTRIHAKMFHDLAIELKKNGHEVIVITPGTPHQKERLHIDFFENIEVWRFRNGTTRGVGKIRRAINETLLSLNAWLAIKGKIKQSPFDICINYSPTIFFGPLMRRLKRNSNVFVYLILRDMFPQWIIDEGMIKESSPIAKYFRYFEKLNYQVSDCIGVMSPANLKLFHKLNTGYKNVKVLMNWSDTKPLGSNSTMIDIRKKWGLQNKVLFFYGGNIGHAQDMTNLMKLAKGLKAQTQAHFLFIGQGDEFNLIKNLKSQWGLNNVTIKPSVSQSTYREILTQVDVGLFSLSAKHTAHNFPGKLLGYMSESLPILGSVNNGNDVIEVINDHNAGMVFVNGDDTAFLDAASELLTNALIRSSKGVNSHQLLHELFSVESAAKHIVETALKEKRA